MPKRSTLRELLDLAGGVCREKLVEALAQQAKEMLDEGVPEDEIRAAMQAVCAKLGLNAAEIAPKGRLH